MLPPGNNEAVPGKNTKAYQKVEVCRNQNTRGSMPTRFTEYPKAVFIWSDYRLFANFIDPK